MFGFSITICSGLIRTDAWYKEQKHVSYHATSSALTALKKQSEFCLLNDVSSVPVQQSLMHLQTAFKNFFAKRTKYPTFKRKHDKQAASYVANAFSWDGKALKLAKMAEPLLIRWARTLPKASKLITVTVSKDAAGRYFVSLLWNDVVSKKPEMTSKVGIDLGLTHFTIL